MIHVLHQTKDSKSLLWRQSSCLVTEKPDSMLKVFQLSKAGDIYLFFNHTFTKTTGCTVKGSVHILTNYLYVLLKDFSTWQNLELKYAWGNYDDDQYNHESWQFTHTLPFQQCRDVHGWRPSVEACHRPGSWHWCEPLSWWACPPHWSGPPGMPSGEGWSRGHLYRGAFTFSTGSTKKPFNTYN